MRFARLSGPTLLAFAALLVAAAPAAARLAVVTTGKPEVAVVDLGRKQVLARPDVGLPSRGVALSLDGLRAYVVASDGSAGLLSTIDLAGNTVVQRIPLPAPARAGRALRRRRARLRHRRAAHAEGSWSSISSPARSPLAFASPSDPARSRCLPTARART